MARNYKKTQAKKNRVYSVEEVMVLYQVSQNTVSNWVGEGLSPSDRTRPYVFRGAELKRFHAERAARTRSQLRPGEFKCMTCKMAVFPGIETVNETSHKKGNHMLYATCPDCGGLVTKLSSAADRDIVADCRNPNTNRHRLHEGSDAVLARIGTKRQFESEKVYFTNDRLVHKWLTHAGRYDDKTIDGHLIAIRYFEDMIDGKSFAGLRHGDVDLVRSDLKRRVK